MASIYDFSATTIDGDEQKLDAYRGKTMLIVNVASKCGFTPQYEGLEALVPEVQGQGLVVLGFPCNQFGHQEPGNEAEIRNSCALTYDVDFPMFAKVDVNGSNTHPLWKYLKHEAKGLLAAKRSNGTSRSFSSIKMAKSQKRYAPADHTRVARKRYCRCALKFVRSPEWALPQHSASAEVTEPARSSRDNCATPDWSYG